jgi:hypothetical protein
MGKPDALSRCTDHYAGKEDNKNQILLNAELFWICALEGARFQGEATELLRNIWKSLKTSKLEDSVAKAAMNLQKDRQQSQVQNSEWDFEGDNLLLFNECIYVLDDLDLCPLHNPIVPIHAGHRLEPMHGL